MGKFNLLTIKSDSKELMGNIRTSFCDYARIILSSYEYENNPFSISLLHNDDGTIILGYDSEYINFCLNQGTIIENSFECTFTFDSIEDAENYKTDLEVSFNNIKDFEDAEMIIDQYENTVSLICKNSKYVPDVCIFGSYLDDKTAKYTCKIIPRKKGLMEWISGQIYYQTGHLWGERKDYLRTTVRTNCLTGSIDISADARSTTLPVFTFGFDPDLMHDDPDITVPEYEIIINCLRAEHIDKMESFIEQQLIASEELDNGIKIITQPDSLVIRIYGNTGVYPILAFIKD